MFPVWQAFAWLCTYLLIDGSVVSWLWSILIVCLSWIGAPAKNKVNRYSKFWSIKLMFIYLHVCPTLCMQYSSTSRRITCVQVQREREQHQNKKTIRSILGGGRSPCASPPCLLARFGNRPLKVKAVKTNFWSTPMLCVTAYPYTLLTAHLHRRVHTKMWLYWRLKLSSPRNFSMIRTTVWVCITSWTCCWDWWGRDLR